MSANKQDTKAAWVDPDDAPELTDEWFDGADVHDGGVLTRRGRGRPRVATPKQQITLRLDADIIERFRATGPGWQARINEALRKAG
ncbi:BrnA antitoxin family protein [Bosea sp. (in: a-proteobacteria)]|jgi:uncharacterized protein (DUF4415 family)|uniref:BrnA antitoxin family protein n=1 Tax=Bosea sp. (in: a-proteobacteria) TaxID=1871050 RepID=UPI002733D248|nr:BrnA antitoxin family protein [Bosea sp. (in: a-proteobacteria)]MDP3408678.1 BrnA antitoxin family protein [Bosea sp. (in: a-proteobacteria)]